MKTLSKIYINLAKQLSFQTQLSTFSFLSCYTLNFLYLRDETLGVEALSLNTIPARQKSRRQQNLISIAITIMRWKNQAFVEAFISYLAYVMETLTSTGFPHQMTSVHRTILPRRVSIRSRHLGIDLNIFRILMLKLNLFKLRCLCKYLAISKS